MTAVFCQFRSAAGLITIDNFLIGAVPLTTELPASFTWTIQFSGLGLNDSAGLNLHALHLRSCRSRYWSRKVTYGRSSGLLGWWRGRVRTLGRPVANPERRFYVFGQGLSQRIRNTSATAIAVCKARIRAGLTVAGRLRRGGACAPRRAKAETCWDS
jgi:hypothetical protein